MKNGINLKVFSAKEIAAMARREAELERSPRAKGTAEGAFAPDAKPFKKFANFKLKHPERAKKIEDMARPDPESAASPRAKGAAEAALAMDEKLSKQLAELAEMLQPGSKQLRELAAKRPAKK